VDGGVVNLDVVLLEVHARGGHLLARHHGDFSREALRRGELALGDVVEEHILEAREVHDFNLGQTGSLGEVSEGIIVRGEHRDRAFAREFTFNVSLRTFTVVSPCSLMSDDVAPDRGSTTHHQSRIIDARRPSTRRRARIDTDNFNPQFTRACKPRRALARAQDARAKPHP